MVGCGGPPRPAPAPPWPEGSGSPRAEIVVDFTRAHGGRVPVSLRMSGVDSKRCAFRFKGENDEYQIHHVRFRDGSGRPIAHERKHKIFTLEPFEGEVVEASYEAEPGGSGRHGMQGVIRDDFATFDGRLFLLPADIARLRAARLRFVTPADWSVATPFRQDGDWYYLDTFRPEDTWILLEKPCMAAGRFDVATRQVGEMEVRVARFRDWADRHKEKLADSSFRILQYFHETYGFDLRSPYLVVWTPKVGSQKVHGGADVNGTCLDHPQYSNRPLQLMTHRVAHAMDKYRPSGMQVAEEHDRWFREGWPSYVEVHATEATQVVSGENYFNTLYSNYKRARQGHPEYDFPLSREGEARGEAVEFIHYTKAPLVTRMLAEVIEARSEYTLEDFMRATWARHGWYQGRFSLRQELEEFTGASFDDFWRTMVDVEGRVIPAWEEFVTDAVRKAMDQPPAARVGGAPISGDYLFHLAQSGDFATFDEVRSFVVSEETRRRQLAERGVELYDEEIRRHLYGLPPEDRHAIARFEASHPLSSPDGPSALRFEVERGNADGDVFDELLEHEREYLAAAVFGKLGRLELRSGSDRDIVPRLAWDSGASFRVVPVWRSAPTSTKVELLQDGRPAKAWNLAPADAARVAAEDRPKEQEVLAFRVTAKSGASMTRAFWQRGSRSDERRRSVAPLPAGEVAPEDSMKPLAWYKSGLVLMSSGESASALRSLTRAVELDAGDPRFWSKHGETLMALGRYDEALRSLDKALALNPTFLAAAGNKALCLAELERRTESLAAIESLMRDSTDETLALIWKGRVLERLNDLEGAAAAFRRGAEQRSNRADGWIRLGHCLLRLERYDEAISAFDKALRLNPSDEQVQRERKLAEQARSRVRR